MMSQDQIQENWWHFVEEQLPREIKKAQRVLDEFKTKFESEPTYYLQESLKVFTASAMKDVFEGGIEAVKAHGPFKEHDRVLRTILRLAANNNHSSNPMANIMHQEVLAAFTRLRDELDEFITSYC